MVTIEKLKGSFAGRANKLYRASFEEWERIPFFALRARSAAKEVEMLAFCEDGEFCGFACLTLNETAAYVQYLAVEESMRGRGLGGQMLDALASHYEGKSVALDIRAVRPGTDGAKLRAQHRKLYTQHRKLYTQHDYKASGYGYKDGGVVYEILVHGEKLERQEYMKLINKLAFGLTQIGVRKMDELK